MTQPGDIQDIIRKQARGEVFGLCIGLALCAFAGFYYYDHLAGGSTLDRFMVWSLRGGVIGFGLCIGLAYIGHHVCFLANAVVSGGLAVVLAVVGVVWASHGFYYDAFALLLGAAFAGHATYRDVQSYLHIAQLVSRADTATPVNTPPGARPPRTEDAPSGTGTPREATPAEVAPPPTPGPSEPPEAPEEGFLAELGREEN